jgi:SAM-dependent methyltransferase
MAERIIQANGGEGPAWSAAAAGWEEHWAGFAAPAREAIALAIEPGASVLDVGCGSGEFCELAAARGARVSGIDAAASMVELARRRVPEADIRVGPVERLPWPDDSFDLVVGVNVFQFAADFVAALTEAARVTRSGGRVAICNWGRMKDREAHAIFEPLTERSPGLPRSDPIPIGDPGVLEDLARRSGLTPERADEVDVPYGFADRAALEGAIRAIAPVYEIAPEAVEPAVAEVIERAQPYRRQDGSYRFDYRFRYLIARA